MPSSACDWSSDVCSSDRSEEHTSELQSRSDLVCRLLLEKKKNTSALKSRSDLACSPLLKKKTSQETDTTTTAIVTSHYPTKRPTPTSNPNRHITTSHILA